MRGDVKVPKRRFKEFQGTEGWEKHKLFELINDIADGPFGSDLKAEHYTDEKEARIIQLSNIGESGWEDENVRYTTFQHAKKIKRSIVQKGELVMAKMMPAGRTIERPNIDKMYILSSDSVRIKLNEFLIDSKYFISMTKSDFFLEQIDNDTQGSTRTRTSISKIKKMDIPVPIFSEQQQIGSYFKQLDNIITLNKRKLEKLKALKKAYLTQMFPAKGKSKPKLRFAGFNNQWEMNRLGDCTGYRRGSFPQPYGNPEWYGGDGAMPFVQIIDVTKDLTLAENTKQTISKLAQPFSIFVKKGSVIVTLQGSIGRVAITQYDAYFDRTILIFENYKYNMNNYFWAYTVQRKFDIEKKKAPGGTIKTITKEALSDFSITLPKRDEQDKIADFFSVLDKLITLHQNKIEKLQNLKKAYLNEMFI